MSLLIDTAYLLGAGLTSPFWGGRMLKTGKWRTDWAERFGCTPLRSSTKPTILIHGVSVGEINAVRELVRGLREKSGGNELDEGAWRIIVSSTTDTGIQQARNNFMPPHQVARQPFDFGPSITHFLDAIKPDLLVLVELEVWPNTLKACQARGIAVCIVNGRLSEHSFRGYHRAKTFVKPMFKRLTAVAAQTKTYADRFAQLGVPTDRVMVLDNMKWDTAQIRDDVPGAEALALALGLDPHKPIIVAGSTGPGEEKLIIDATPKNAQLILVPRKPERFEEVADIASHAGRLVRRSHHPKGTVRHRTWNEKHIGFFLLDTMGELTKAYALADLVIVGRSFNGQGGSDPIEPIALGKPTLIGHDHHHFQDIVDAFTQAGGIGIIKDLPAAIHHMLACPDEAKAMAQKGRKVIQTRQGSTAKHIELITSLMPKTTYHKKHSEKF